jgi:hypothetical protein
MFSGALLEVLKVGDLKGVLTLKRSAELVQGQIKRAFGNQAVKPQIHVPVQGDQDILQSPYFPDPELSAQDHFTVAVAPRGEV